MMVVNARDRIPATIDRIVQRFRPLRIILFGAYARGEAGQDNDVDLLAVLPAVDDKRGAAVELRRALADFPVPEDVVVATPDEIPRRGKLVGTVLREALREGKVLFARA